MNPMVGTPADMPLQRIAIVGVSGSGKTTLARQLAQRLGLTHVELDSLYWDPGWAPAPRLVFRQRAEQAFRAARWVVDGNHPEVRDIIWAQADTVLWLDYGLPLVMWRLLRRTFQRCQSGEVLWNGNRERSLGAHFFSSKSIFLWALRTYWLRRREYPALLGAPEHAHLCAIRLRSPQQTRAWLARVPSALPVLG